MKNRWEEARKRGRGEKPSSSFLIMIILERLAYLVTPKTGQFIPNETLVPIRVNQSHVLSQFFEIAFVLVIDFLDYFSFQFFLKQRGLAEEKTVGLPESINF